MIDIDAVRQLALSFPEAEEQAHFDKPSFRVRGKIFMTLWENERRVVLKLSPGDQMAFMAMESEGILPIPGAWGDKGWTSVQLDAIDEGLLEDALTTAWRQVAPKKLRAAYEARS